MKFTHKLVGFSLASFAVFYIASLLPQRYLVFGNMATGQLQAITTSAILIGIVISLVEPIAKDYNIKMHDNQWMVVYYVVNSLVIYFLARSPISYGVGMGIIGFWVAFVLGFFVNLVQYWVWKFAGDRK